MLVMIGCATSSKAPKLENIPSWIQTRPNQAGYYIGIASARKTKPDYMQTAKQNALADLASDISVVISSQSVINTIQLQNNFSEDFISTIRAEVQKEIEDYEIVDTWEDAQNYWVYCRLSKETYKQKIEEKKSSAASRALDYYDKAIKSKENNDSKSAIVMLVKALEILKPYFAEDINITYNDHSIFLGNEIITMLNNILNSLTISGPTELNVKLGQTIHASSLTYFVKNNNGIPQKAIPLKINYFDRTANKSMITNNMGEASFNIESIRSKKKNETLRIEVDFESIIKEASRDVTINLALSRTKTPYFETYLTIIRPIFYITSEERNLDQVLSENPIAEAIKSRLLEAGFPVTDNPQEADYKINIKANTLKTGQSQQYEQVTLNLKLNALNSHDNTVFAFSIDKLNASHFDPTKAGMQAYNEVIKRIESSVTNDLINRIINSDKVY